MSNLAILGIEPIDTPTKVQELTLDELLAWKPTKKAKEQIMFVDLERTQFLSNPVILRRYFTNEDYQPCFFANLLGLKREFPIDSVIKLDVKNRESKYFSFLKKKLKQDFGKDVSLKGYRYDPKHFVYSTCYDQLEYEENWFKYKTSEEENDEKEYERRHERIEPVDFEAIEKLEKVFFKALKKRLVILLNIGSVPMLINNALVCYHLGVTCSAANAALNAKLAEIRKILEDKEASEWIKAGNNDIVLYALDDTTKCDYIETYQKALRALTDIRDEDLSYCLSLIDNEADPLQDEILANDVIEFSSYDDNSLNEDEDEDILDDNE